MALPSPSAVRYAGEALHGLVEAARRGEAGDPPDAARLAALWRTVLADIERRASSNGDGAWLPLSESLDSLERTRLWAIRLALVQKVGRGTGGGAGSTERRLQSKDGLVAGRVDAIDYRDGRIVLRDFKSGAVVDAAGIAKVEYSTQMLLYAALFEEIEGHWLDVLELVDRRGVSTEVKFSPDEARETLARARTLLLSIHQGMGEGGTLASLAALARPDGGECARCRHRPLCPRYLDGLLATSSVRHGDHPYSPVDVVGQMVGCEQTGNGLSITLRAGQRSIAIQGVQSPGEVLDGGAPNALPVPGTWIVIFGAIPRRRAVDGTEPIHFVASRATRGYRLPSRAASSDDGNPR